MTFDLFSELGFDPDDPEVVAARADAEDLTRLVEALRNTRSERGLRQSDIAERMGTTQSAVSDIERLGGDPRLSTLQRYARSVGGRIRCRLDITTESRDWQSLDVPIDWEPAEQSSWHLQGHTAA